MPNVQTVYNPLDHVKTNEGYLTNMQHGICPKCERTMRVINCDTFRVPQDVYLCDTCRVVEPLPN